MNSRTLWIVLGLAIAAVPGCSADASNASGSTDPGDPSSPNAVQGTGSVGLQLMLPAGQSIEVIDWAITGPNNATTVVRSGAANSQSLGVSFQVGGIPVGNGYSIALSGTATDGSVTCTGSAPFNITPRATTPVSVQLACGTATEGAHVTRINGASYNCAAWSNVSASPTETTVGSSVTVSATANAPVPGSLAYMWSAPSGSFDSASSATAHFQCTEVGPVAVTLVVSDGPVPAGDSCSTALSTRTITVTCDAMDAQAPPPPVPAMPPWSLFAMATGMMATGAAGTRRRQRA